MSEKNNFNNLTYFFTNPNLAPIIFIGFRGSLNIYNEIGNGNISIKKAEEDQNKFKSSLSEITARNPKYKKQYQVDAIEKIKTFLIQDKTLSIYLMIMLKLNLKLCLKQKMELDLKYELLNHSKISDSFCTRKNR